MGRGKIEIKRIENSTNRQVTFSKRRNGILKKAREISVLCDAEVGVVVFSSAGKLYDYCSPKTSLSKILEKYQTNSGKILWGEKHKSLSAEIDRIKKENDTMQIELRHLKGEDLNSLQPKDLIMIEEALDNGLTNLNEKLVTNPPSQSISMRLTLQMEHWERRVTNTKMMEDENKLLAFKLHQQDIALSGSMRELELGYHPDRDLAAQMPITFRVQPSHPNLQENN
ncbi:MADS-box transcription factor 2 [Zea mays]|uniref:MADS-box transcription factor 2 n=2 Tax=Zea mays TaxID=4577 RepID=A0A8J8Y6Q8_MAIZE|nr:Floral homeotic protein PISTILLATA [Zea mays]PWZ30118.1 MADS-box transcription factor 2 [Zea mays]